MPAADMPLADQTGHLDTFVMLRRMALLAWIGSHIEAPEPQALARHFAGTTARLGQDWLDRQVGSTGTGAGPPPSARRLPAVRPPTV